MLVAAGQTGLTIWTNGNRGHHSQLLKLPNIGNKCLVWSVLTFVWYSNWREELPVSKTSTNPCFRILLLMLWVICWHTWGYGESSHLVYFCTYFVRCITLHMLKEVRLRHQRISLLLSVILHTTVTDELWIGSVIQQRLVGLVWRRQCVERAACSLDVRRGWRVNVWGGK